MARVGWGRHTTVVTGTNDGTKQVSMDAWNTDVSKVGMLGFTIASKTIATGVVTPIDTCNTVEGEGAANDDLDYITYAAAPDIAAEDLVFLYKGANVITVRHNQGSPGANQGKIILLGAENKTLDANVPLILQRKGTDFYEIASNLGITNVMISATAALAYSKLSLANSIVNADINTSAAIALSKLAALTSGNIIVGSAGNVATAVVMSGDATIVASGALTLATTVRVIGLQDLFVPASAMWARTTTGAGGLTKVETPTNKHNYQVFEFDTATSEFVQFAWIPLRNYNNGTVKATFYWTNAAGLTTETVDFEIAGVAISNDDVLDAAFGTLVVTTDTWLAQNDLHVSPQSTAITIAGTPADSDYIIFQIDRKVSTDNLTGDARLIGIVLEYTIDSAVAA